MGNEDQRIAAFQKFLDEGLESLSTKELRLYRAHMFISLWYNGGLSGYLYNTLPDHDEINRVIEALQQLGLTACYECLSEAYEFFKNYRDSGAPSTWGEVRQIYDPDSRVDEISDDLGKRIEEDLR